MRLEGFEPPTTGLEGRRSSTELQARGYRVAPAIGLFDELGLRLGVRRMPGPEEEIELHPHVVVAQRGQARDLHRVRADAVRDEVTLLEERDESIEVGGVLNSDAQRVLSLPNYGTPERDRPVPERGIWVADRG